MSGTSTPAATFRHAETVGSLLRPEALLAARRDHAAGSLTAEALAAIEDQAVRDAIALQERVGLDIITDGELRRNTYIDFVVTGLTGVQLTWQTHTGVSYRDSSGAAASTPRATIAVTGRIAHAPASTGPRDFRFLAATTQRQAKATIVGPAIIHFNAGRAGIDADTYPNLDDFWSDLITAYGTELANLRAAGCTYVQFDETSLIKLVDLEVRRHLLSRGDDPDRLIGQYLAVLRAIFLAAPKDMRLSLHLCRGNNRGTWQAQGGYDGIAAQMFATLPAQVYSLEYDTPRAGGFEPLRQLPANAMVILGLLSTKIAEAEDADRIEARIRDASQHVPLERLGVSPQCGFWGGMNLCTPAQAEAKLHRVVEVARRVWN